MTRAGKVVYPYKQEESSHSLTWWLIATSSHLPQIIIMHSVSQAHIAEFSVESAVKSNIWSTLRTTLDLLDLVLSDTVNWTVKEALLIWKSDYNPR